MTADRLASLRRRPDFERIFRSGERLWRGAISVIAASGVPGIARVGIVVPKRLGGAVVRNKLRRRLREISRRAASRLTAGTDYVVVVNEMVDFQKLEDEWMKALEREKNSDR